MFASRRTTNLTAGVGAAGAGALWALFAGIAAVSSVLVMRRPAAERLSDLHIYYGAVQAVHSGRPLYGYVAENGGPFTYPPFAMVLLRPIAAVPEPILQVAWLVLTCAAVAAVAVVVGGALAAGGPTSPRATRHRQLAVAAGACAVMLSAPAQSNLRFGQVSVFIVLLALVDAVGLTPARHRGVLVGVAAAVKLTPLLFIGFFLVARRSADAGRAVAAFVACAALAAAVLPADSWAYWTGTMLETSRIGNLASLGNQSVHGMLLRVGAPPGVLPVVWAGLIAVICGAALVRARRLQLDGLSGRAAVLVGCATVAASPVSWTHHQIWTVLAAMLLIATRAVAQRAAGVLLLVVMTVSLGALLGDVSTYPGVQFLFENARSLGAVAVCLAGCGGVAAVAAGRRTTRARFGLRLATVAAATLAGFALLPLPAGADPTFKAYKMDDAANPRYFFVSHAWAVGASGSPPGSELRWGEVQPGAVRPGVLRFGVLREKTKVRVNGVVEESVARLEYRSAPGGSPRDIPLLRASPGEREFSFRSASLAHGRLVAYGADGRVLATFTNELDP
jgi:alpha-1,2-mannosyltransferase